MYLHAQVACICALPSRDVINIISEAILFEEAAQRLFHALKPLLAPALQRPGIVCSKAPCAHHIQLSTYIRNVLLEAEANMACM